MSIFINPHLFTTLGLGAVLFLGGAWLSRRVTGRRRWLAAGILCLCALPGAAMLGYYAHLFGEPRWYLEFRTLPGVEILTAGITPIFGFLAATARAPRKPWQCSNRFWGFLAACFLFIPFCKPVLLPLGPLTDEWDEGVCLQSTEATCGPASLATIFAGVGQRRSEAEIARACYSYRGGTEIWYLMRYARAHGLRSAYRHQPRLSEIPTPAILGTRLGPTGHFITLLGKEKGLYVIGDPLVGRLRISEQEFRNTYTFHGAVYTFSR